MKNFEDIKNHFSNLQAESFVKEKVMDYIKKDMQKDKKLALSYKKFYKIAFVPVFLFITFLGGYFYYQNNNSLENEIVKTQKAINEFIAMNDYKIY